MNTIIPIASGKGGVGKTIFTANLGITLAKMGKTVIAIDLDLGSSNLHTCLGIKNRHPGIGNFIYNKGISLESLIVKTDIDRLYFIPGDSLIPGTANMQYFIKKKLIKAIQNLVADYILLDLGAGTSYNIIDFFLISKTGLLVTTPETTSILSAYAFLKTTVFRMLFRSFPVKSKERELIHNFLTERIEGTDNSFITLTNLLRNISPESGDYGLKQIADFYPRVILNIGRNKQAITLGSKLRQICKKNIGINMEYIGFIEYTELVSASIINRSAIMLTSPDSQFARALRKIAENLINITYLEKPTLYDFGEDLENLDNFI
ncbi:MAG: P-loop NTPase [Spirochaetia bacterium]|jgi:flagellar biosynthesis protein FlhG|nr:P-loop NTPase [Spirochaetia bacterium]